MKNHLLATRMFLSRTEFEDYNVIMDFINIQSIYNYVKTIENVDTKILPLNGNMGGALFLFSITEKKLLHYMIKFIDNSWVLYILKDEKRKELEDFINPKFYDPEWDTIKTENIPTA